MKHRNTPPHGFELAAEDHNLLRSAPPARALRWAASTVGRGATLVQVWALEGGASSAMHALDVRDHRGVTHHLVLRRFVRPDWLAEEPHAPMREAAALELVGKCPIRTPELLAVDGDGTEAGVPALLMTRLAGRVDWHPTDLEPFLRNLASLLPRIHATPLSAEPGIPSYDPYELGLKSPPQWASQPKVWLQAMELFDEAPPPGDGVFIHRDYHPGNVLWVDGEVAGVVDWVHASIGSPDADVGHCRANLAGRFGLTAADRFLELYLTASGRSGYHPYWDIVAALGGHDEDYFDEPSPEDEHFLAHALRRLRDGLGAR
jgi:aminoglycoside phosphotransferase (APT) family kinase protein